MKSYDELKELFLIANQSFLEDAKELLVNKASERALCGALLLHLNRQMLRSDGFDGYYTDIEYNRNRGNQNRNNTREPIKTIRHENGQIDNITCDLIMHSRGTILEQDNLIAIEMKKSNRSPKEKVADKNRLKALTKDTFHPYWEYDGETLPVHVCRYVIGIYYEINFKKSCIALEFYRQGDFIEKTTLMF